MPDLAAEDDWLEAPFWGSAGSANRSAAGSLHGRTRSSGIELRVGREIWPAAAVDAPEAMPSAHGRELESSGLKVRSRALTNTLFARLFLCDLFIHGIGGGKYDEADRRDHPPLL